MVIAQGFEEIFLEIWGPWEIWEYRGASQAQKSFELPCMPGYRSSSEEFYISRDLKHI